MPVEETLRALSCPTFYQRRDASQGASSCRRMSSPRKLLYSCRCFHRRQDVFDIKTINPIRNYSECGSQCIKLVDSFWVHRCGRTSSAYVARRTHASTEDSVASCEAPASPLIQTLIAPRRLSVKILICRPPNFLGCASASAIPCLMPSLRKKRSSKH